MWWQTSDWRMRLENASPAELREALLALRPERDQLSLQVAQFEADAKNPPAPIPMHIVCPICKARHIDEGEFATKVHHTHSCQKCGLTWRPAVVPTVGVQFLPGFKNGVICNKSKP
jgi:rubredoxin